MAHISPPDGRLVGGRWGVAGQRGFLERLGEVQDETAPNASGGEPSMRFGGLLRWQDVGDSKSEDALVVLSTLVWASPHQYPPEVDPDTMVNIDFGTEARWHLVGRDYGWALEKGLADSPSAAITADVDSAWRQLTGAPVSVGAVIARGPADLAQPPLDVRGIIV